MCKKDIIAKNSSFVKPNRRFCSHSCRTIWQNKNVPQSEHQRKMTSERYRALFKGKTKSIEHRLKLRKSQLGSKSHFWKGGLTDKNRKLRNSMFTRNWRNEVYKRDNWTCQQCKARSSAGNAVKLSAHHIKPWFSHPETRFDVNNGVTLCVGCHKKTDSFASKTNHLDTVSKLV